jgi:hypothetical protein
MDVLLKRLPTESLVERNEGRSAEEKPVLWPHCPGVVHGRRYDQPCQSTASQVRRNSHPADARHLCADLSDRYGEPQQTCVCDEAALLPDAEMIFLG